MVLTTKDVREGSEAEWNKKRVIGAFLAMAPASAVCVFFCCCVLGVLLLLLLPLFHIPVNENADEPWYYAHNRMPFIARI